MRSDGDLLVGSLERTPLQLSLVTGLHLGALLSFRDLQKVCTARLVLATVPELIAKLPRSRLGMWNDAGRLPLHTAAAGQASVAVVAALIRAHPGAAWAPRSCVPGFLARAPEAVNQRSR